MKFDFLHNIAIEVLKNKPSTTKHITFITLRRNIICFGLNITTKTSPLAQRFGQRCSCIHSELSAIKNFPYPIKKLRHYDIINMRILANGNVSMSHPCKACTKMLSYFDVKKMYYTNFSGKFRKLIL